MQTQDFVQQSYSLPESIKAQLDPLDFSSLFTANHFIDFVKSVLKEEADHHGADFNEDGFQQHVREAFKNHQLQAYALETLYGNGSHDHAGVIIVQPTVRTSWNPELKIYEKSHGLWVEDTFVKKTVSWKFRDLLNEMNQKCNVTLGDFINHEMFRLSVTPVSTLSATPYSKEIIRTRVAGGYTAECGENNAPMHRIYKKLGVDPLSDPDLFVMKLTGKPEAPVCRKSTASVVSLVEWSQNGQMILPVDYAFTVKWWRNKQAVNGDTPPEVHIDFTRGISTFTGQPVFRCMVTHNNEQLSKTLLNKAYAQSAILAAHEICKKGWNRGLGFDEIFPQMYFHLQDQGSQVNKLRMDALTSIGAKRRRLGRCFMKPISIDYSRIDQHLFLNAQRLPATQLHQATLDVPDNRPRSNAAEMPDVPNACKIPSAKPSACRC